MRTDETKNEINEIKKGEGKIKGKGFKNKTKNYTNDFQQYETISSLRTVLEFSNKSR